MALKFKISCLFFCFIFSSFFLISCSNRYSLTYNTISTTYIKEDSISNIYHGYNEDLGLRIPFFNIDSIYGNKRKAWIIASINDTAFVDDNICLYSCSKSYENRKGYRLNKKMGCVDKTGKIRMKLRYDNDTILFISKPSIDTFKGILYELTNLSVIK